MQKAGQDQVARERGALSWGATLKMGTLLPLINRHANLEIR
jgi:hypothetical protein